MAFERETSGSVESGLGRSVESGLESKSVSPRQVTAASPRSEGGLGEASSSSSAFEGASPSSAHRRALAAAVRASLFVRRFAPGMAPPRALARLQMPTAALLCLTDGRMGFFATLRHTTGDC